MGTHRKSKLMLYSVCMILALSGVSYSQTIDRIVAIVGEDVITLRDLRKALGLKDNAELVKLPKATQEKALDTLIETKLIEEKAKQSSITVSAQELDEEIENVKKANNITAEGLLEALKKEGLTMADYRETVRKQIMKAKLINREVRSQVSVNDENIANYYNKEIAADREILVNIDVITFYDDGKGDLDGDIKTYYKMAKGNVLFEEINKKAALRYRTVMSAPRSVKLSGLAFELREALQDIKVGELGQLIRFSGGYQIFRLLSRSYEGLKPFEAVKDELKNSYVKSRTEKAFSDWLSEVKKEIYVEKRL